MSIYGTAATRDRRGWFFGLTGPQVILVLGTAAPCWLAMAVGDWAALLVLVPVWLLTMALICVPIRGWSAAQWIGVLARHRIGQATGWSQWRSLAASGDHREERAADLPGTLAGVEIHDGPPMDATTRPAIIQHSALRTWAVTARIVHPGIGMADAGERERLGAGLAELMETTAATGQLDLLALQVRTVPDDGSARAQWLLHHARADEPRVSAQIHHQLDGTLSGAAVRSETFLTIVVREDKIAREARRAGRGLSGRARVLYALASEVESRLLGSIGCTHVDWLTAATLAAAIRTGFEPGDAQALADSFVASQPPHLTAGAQAGVPVAAAGPTQATTSMRSYRHGEWESVSTSILLPRKGALMGALARAMVPSQIGERRALTVFYRPVPQGTAERDTSRAEMSAAMAAEMRRKVGRVERARDRHAVRQLWETDEKLERGRSLVLVSAVAAVTVPRSWAAQDNGRRLDAAVRLCGFTPLPLDGAHDAAFAAAAIPLGVGVPRRGGR